MSAEAWAWCVSACVFAAGAAFIALRRQLVAMVIGVELMVNSANILLAFHAARRADAQGLAAVLLVLAAAAAEVVVGLTLILAMRRDEQEPPETDQLTELRG